MLDALVGSSPRVFNSHMMPTSFSGLGRAERTHGLLEEIFASGGQKIREKNKL